MTRLPRHVIDDVRERTDLVALVQRSVTLHRRGNRYVGLCPFHQEKSPSFHVIPDKELFHCFGCQESGDAFRFVMKMENLSFIEAVKELATAAGVVIEERELTPEERRALHKRATSYDALEAAAQFFEQCLWTRPEGAEAREYLQRRKLDPQIAREARLGYAPDAWTATVDHLQQRGFGIGLLAEVGLARQKEGASSHYDTFRDRVVFPISDEKGRVIGFGGRILRDAPGAPKYINSPEGPVYQKKTVLYGLDVARKAIQSKGRVIVVEGYMDVLGMRQGGFAESIATCGTALTDAHLEKIRRLTTEVVALFDSDEAGQRAAERSLPLFLAAGLQPWRLELPDAKDPDELIREHGPAAMETALQQKEPLLEWLLSRRLAARGGSASGQASVLDDVLPMLVGLPPAVLSSVAAKLRVNEAALLERVRRHAPPPVGMPGEPPPRSGWRPTQEIVHILWLLVHRRDQVADVIGSVEPSLLGDEPELRAVAARLLSGEPVAGVLPDVDEPTLRRTLSAVVARDKLYEPDQAALGACQLVDRLARPRREARMASLVHDAEAARQRGDWDRWRGATTLKARLVEVRNSVETSISKADIPAVLAALADERALLTAGNMP